MRKLGVGGMAEVWMGRRVAMAGASKTVAIKLLGRDVLDDPAYREMFLEEARLSMLLTNSNVVQVFDVGEVDGECYMVMEWVDGMNLSELTRQMAAAGEPVPVGVATHIIAEVLHALAYAHGLHHEGAKATIVHRDVSPHNVLVSISGEVKLADFGVARLAREETSGLHVKGKLRYMAPEQLRGRSREPTVDLYAVGAIFHEMLEGERFRSTRDEGDLYAMVLSGECPPLRAQVPAELEALRRGLLDPDPVQRIPSAEKALELLYAWPGFRNSSIELTHLARRYADVRGPRSGIVSSKELFAQAQTSAPAPAARPRSGAASVASAAVTAQALGSSSPSGPMSGVSDAVTAIESSQPESGPLADRGGTTRTHVEIAESDTAPTSLITPAPGPRQGLPAMMMVAAITLALSFGVFGLGFPLGWWGGGDQSVAANTAGTESGPEATKGGGAEAGEAEAGEPDGEDATTGSAEGSQVAITGQDGGTSGSADETEPVEPTEGGEDADSGPDAVDAVDAVDATGGEDTTGEVVEPPPPEPVKIKPAQVKFKLAPGRNYIEMKIRGKIYKLSPTAEGRLPPGSHSVWVNLDWTNPNSKWAKVSGKARVEEGESYEMTVTDTPPGFKLTKL